MSEPAPPKLVSSQSFAGTASPSVVTNIPTRRMPSTSALEFFAPASKSFQPLPYTPHALFSTSDKGSKVFTTRHNQRAQEALAHPGMDPLPTDPNVVFIHPPFLSFPDSHLHKDGLSYQVLAQNPEWFLDPNDFIRKTNSAPGAIPYPPILEPPRGWCPARKKDLKERGVDGWPEGEEPRLRCTFCRRTYAGVNAKSMWRRHVFEKHKIAMSNRRDGNDKIPRGRGTGKENKQTSSTKPREEPHDKLLNMEVAPQTNAIIEGHKSKFRTALPPEDTKSFKGKDRKEDVFVVPKSPELCHASGSKCDVVDPKLEDAIQLADAPEPSLLDPSQSVLLDQADDQLLQQLSGDLDSALPIRSTLGPFLSSDLSPTPSFRHSPPPLPSDQPWRYPSPSHPKYSLRDIPLTMLAPTPLSKSVLLSGRSPQSSPFSTPNLSRSSDLKTPSTFGFSLKSSSRPWLFSFPLGSPLDKHSKSKGPATSSPLSSSLRGTPARHKRDFSTFSDDLFGDSSLHPDPFVINSPWNRIVSGSSPRKVARIFGDVSPVLRVGSLPTDVDLGAGLLEPFGLPKEEPKLEDLDADLGEMEKPEIGKLAGPSVSPKDPPSDSPSYTSPPPKKRRKVLSP